MVDPETAQISSHFQSHFPVRLLTQVSLAIKGKFWHQKCTLKYPGKTFERHPATKLTQIRPQLNTSYYGTIWNKLIV